MKRGRRCAVGGERNRAGMPLMLFLLSMLAPSPAQTSPSTQAADASAWTAGHTIVNPAVKFDRSAPLPQLLAGYQLPPRPDRRRSTTAPVYKAEAPPPAANIGPQGAAVEQVTQGPQPAAMEIANFDGLGSGFHGPQGTAEARNPSDNSLAVGPDEIVQIVNSRMAIFTKKGAKYPQTGKALFGPVVTNTLFVGFGGACEKQISGDAVARYDQLAHRWLFVLPIFRKASDELNATYGMCYAVSTSPDPMGAYFRYEFKRPLFPDYPRPAIWPDGYYVPTSTGDTVIQKHICAANRSRMLEGLSASEQCWIIDGASFLNAADVDGSNVPRAGMPEIVMAAGGTQLHQVYEDNALYAWKFAVNWSDPSQTRLTGPEKISVAPYHFQCNGQLNECVPQPETDVRLDSQGDKLMQRLVYRKLGRQQFIVTSHSIDTKAGGGGVRWYEFRVDSHAKLGLMQQGTYAPDGGYRWMPSIAMDRKGGIGVGYSFGDASSYPGQRFAARMPKDAKGQMTLHESVVAAGEASQTNTLRWEDYTTLDIDPSDDCTFWYVGDYLKKGEQDYSTRIGGYRLPGCAANRKLLGIF